MSIVEESKNSQPEEDNNRYHHGDLRAALLTAAEIELAEKGIEKFSLRGVARRAGVSHAAPAHHFGDSTGLLTALAAIGFQRMVTIQRARQAKQRRDDDLAQLVAAGRGYIKFATANPALFQLMFSSSRPNRSDVTLKEAAGAAFDLLLDEVYQLTGTDPRTDQAAMVDVMASWAVVHGIADLLNSGQLKFLQDLRKSERKAMINDVIARVAAR